MRAVHADAARSDARRTGDCALRDRGQCRGRPVHRRRRGAGEARGARGLRAARLRSAYVACEGVSSPSFRPLIVKQRCRQCRRCPPERAPVASAKSSKVPPVACCCARRSNHRRLERLSESSSRGSAEACHARILARSGFARTRRKEARAHDAIGVHRITLRIGDWAASSPSCWRQRSR